MNDYHEGHLPMGLKLDEAREAYAKLKTRDLKLDMSRGKPSPEQLDLARPLLAWNGADDYLSEDGVDCRNYGGPALGLPEARRIFTWMTAVPEDRIAVVGNSSLALMYDVISFLVLHGTPGGAPAWTVSRPISFLCPVPGYDRHFAILEALGIEMIAVPLLRDGPDMAFVEDRVAKDPSIKGMWCMPRFSNPSGTIYSEETVQRLASMATAAADFHLFWDDAYAVHHLSAEPAPAPDILGACTVAGHPDRPFVFASTSKITLAGAGLAALASSPRNLAWWQRHAGIRSIGPDKLNQLRHARFLRSPEDLRALMAAHRNILAPKFEAVVGVFQQMFRSIAGIEWTEPKGGYFVSLQVPPGCARRSVELAAEAGIVLTPAGAAFPYGTDPDDRHLRIAPSYPSLDEIRAAAEGVAVCVRLAAAERTVGAEA